MASKKRLYGYTYPAPVELGGGLVEGQVWDYSKLSVKQRLYSELAGKNVNWDQITVERLEDYQAMPT